MSQKNKDSTWKNYTIRSVSARELKVIQCRTQVISPHQRGQLHMAYLAGADWMWLPDKSSKLLTSAGSREEGRLELEHEWGWSMHWCSPPLLASPRSLPVPLSSPQSSSSSSNETSSFTTCTKTMTISTGKKCLQTNIIHEYQFEQEWKMRSKCTYIWNH